MYLSPQTHTDMAKRYEKSIQLNSYRVDRDLILDIENYCYTQIPRQLDIKTPFVDEMVITLHTSKKKMTYQSINEYQNSSFKDVHAIHIDYSYYDDSRGIVVSIRFDANGENSYLQTCVYDDREIKILPLIQTGILNTISNHKTRSRFSYSPESTLFPVLVLSIIICFFGIIMGNGPVRIISILIIALITIFLVAFRHSKGHAHFM
jgi:hypothetical protein